MEGIENAKPEHQLPNTKPDEIVNFDNLRQNLSKKLQLKNWIVVTSHPSLYIFNLNKKSNGNLSIRNTICVDIDLTVKVFGRVGHAGDDTLLNMKVYRWPQLQNLLEQLGDNVKREDDFHAECVVETPPNSCGVKDGNKNEDDAATASAFFEFCAVTGVLTTEAGATSGAHPALYDVFADQPLHTVDSVDEMCDSSLSVKKELSSSEEPQDVLVEHSTHPYTCSECDKSYDQNAKLIRHQKMHQTHVCPLCNETFTGRMDQHMQQHSKQSYQCYICGWKFQSQRPFDKHMHIRHSGGGEEFYCDICKNSKNFESKISIERHMRRQHNEDGKKIEHFQLEWVRAHEERIRQQLAITSDGENSAKKSDQTVNKCTTCDKEFPSHTNLRLHMQQHGKVKPQLCTICNKYYSRLPHHVNVVHRQAKSYVCDVCGSTFSEQRMLNIHMTVKHTPGEMLYCTICQNGHVFRSRAYLKKHLAGHARATVQKTDTIFEPGLYECEQCDQKFPSKYTLKSHTTLQHSDADGNGTQYQCKVCDKKFGVRSALTVHEKLHTGNTHICHYCGQSFRHPNYLRKHVNRHKVPPQKKPCTMCDKQYANGFDLRLHMKKVHDIVVIPNRYAVPPVQPKSDSKLDSKLV